MNVIESLLADAERHEADLSRRVKELQGELKDTKHMLREVARHRERLARDRSRGAPTLPLGEPMEQEVDLDVIHRELDEAEDADDDEAATHWDDEPTEAEEREAALDNQATGTSLTDELMAIAPILDFDAPDPVEAPSEPVKPKRGRKKAEAANG